MSEEVYNRMFIFYQLSYFLRNVSSRENNKKNKKNIIKTCLRLNILIGRNIEVYAGDISIKLVDAITNDSNLNTCRSINI